MIATPTSMLAVEAAVLRLKHAFMRLHEKECSQLAELLPMLRLTHPNVLIMGDPRDGTTFERMIPFLRPPIAKWTPRHSAAMPAAPFRTLLIAGGDELDAAQQEQLLELVSRTAGDIQVVTTSAMPLLPLVSRGMFLDRLYYQLNVILLEHP
jgi:hypothetical protein